MFTYPLYHWQLMAVTRSHNQHITSWIPFWNSCKYPRSTRTLMGCNNRGCTQNLPPRCHLQDLQLLLAAWEGQVIWILWVIDCYIHKHRLCGFSVAPFFRLMAIHVCSFSLTLTNRWLKSPPQNWMIKLWDSKCWHNSTDIPHPTLRKTNKHIHTKQHKYTA